MSKELAQRIINDKHLLRTLAAKAGMHYLTLFAVAQRIAATA